MLYYIMFRCILGVCAFVDGNYFSRRDFRFRCVYPLEYFTFPANQIDHRPLHQCTKCRLHCRLLLPDTTGASF